MKKVILPLLLSVFALVAAPTGARAVAINFSYTMNFYPPNPCAGSTLSGSIGLFDITGDGSPIVSSPGPPEASCGESFSDSFVLFAAPGTDIYFSFEGAIHIPDPGPPEAPVFAFAAGTREGDSTVADIPFSAPLISLGSVDIDGILCPSPGPPELPLFAFSSLGTQVGSISVAMSPVPEPSTMILLGSGICGLVLMRRFRKG